LPLSRSQHQFLRGAVILVGYINLSSVIGRSRTRLPVA
jgi:hypothetical protein